MFNTLPDGSNLNVTLTMAGIRKALTYPISKENYELLLGSLGRINLGAENQEAPDFRFFVSLNGMTVGFSVSDVEQINYTWEYGSTKSGELVNEEDELEPSMGEWERVAIFFRNREMPMELGRSVDPVSASELVFHLDTADSNGCGFVAITDDHGENLHINPSKVVLVELDTETLVRGDKQLVGEQL